MRTRDAPGRRRNEGALAQPDSTADDPPEPLTPGLHERDCVEAMAALPADSFDLAIVDPPYNVSKGGAWQWDNSVDLPGFGGDWAKIKEHWDDYDLPGYMAFTRAWMGEVRRLVRPTGSIWIHGTYHNIGLINFVMQMLGIEIINEVVWFKRNSFPNLSGRRLTASHETILWAHTGRGKREYFFDYEKAKALACPEDRIKAAGKQMRTVWDIPNNKAKDELACGKHPAQKPVRLILRMLAVSAPAAARVLVPFAGAGSECVAAARRGLSFVAFENDPAYADVARRRLAREAAERPVPAVESKR